MKPWYQNWISYSQIDETKYELLCNLFESYARETIQNIDKIAREWDDILATCIATATEREQYRLIFPLIKRVMQDIMQMFYLVIRFPR